MKKNSSLDWRGLPDDKSARKVCRKFGGEVGWGGVKEPFLKLRHIKQE